MFTGLVQLVAPVARIRDRGATRRLEVAAALPTPQRALGASVCVQGACLTVVEGASDRVAFDVAFETLRRTTLGDLRAGNPVNLEPSLAVGDPLGGHLVTGHVDGVGIARQIRPRGEAREVWFEAPATVAPFLAAKGSVCVDGVSLTINEVRGRRFMVGLVPHTLEVTTLGQLRVGTRVNLEADLIARYVARWLEGRAASGLPPEEDPAPHE